LAKGVTAKKGRKTNGSKTSFGRITNDYFEYCLNVQLPHETKVKCHLYARR